MTAQSFGQALGGYGRRKSKGNPDAPTGPVRACSYDLEDPRAKPHASIGDVTARQKWAFCNALLGA